MPAVSETYPDGMGAFMYRAVVGGRVRDAYMEYLTDAVARAQKNSKQ